MMTTAADRRRAQRAYFTRENRLQAVFSASGHGRLPRANVMDISADGLGISFGKGTWPEVRPGDRLTLVTVSDGSPLKFLKNIQVQVRWVLNHDHLQHIAAGGEFVTISLPMRVRILHYIASHAVRPNPGLPPGPSR